MTNNFLDQRYGVYGLLGSVWAEKLSGASLRRARAMVGLARRSGFGDRLVECVRNLSGQPQALVSGDVLTFDPRDVGELGPDRQKRIHELLSLAGVPLSYIRRPGPDDYDFPQTGHTGWRLDDPDTNSNFIVTTESECEYMLMPAPDATTQVAPTQADWITRYLIPIPYGFVPLRVRSFGGAEFFNGLDFEVGEGVLVMRRPPAEIFPNNQILIESAWRRQSHLFNYTLALGDIEGSVAPVVKWARDEQSAATFLQALACACNFVIAPWDSTVISRAEMCGRYVYEFAEGVLEVRYPHVLLSPGDTVDAGEVVGGVLEILAPGYTGDASWWRTIPWNSGLSLDALCPFVGLVIPDTPCRATAVSQTGSNLHVEIALGNEDTVSEGKFWTAQHRSERMTGNYLNDLVGLASIGDFTYLNPLELYFKYLLAARSWIVTRKMFSSWDNDRAERFRHFVKREAPFSGLIIVRDL